MEISERNGLSEKKLTKDDKKIVLILMANLILKTNKFQQWMLKRLNRWITKINCKSHSGLQCNRAVWQAHESMHFLCLLQLQSRQLKGAGAFKGDPIFVECHFQYSTWDYERDFERIKNLQRTPVVGVWLWLQNDLGFRFLIWNICLQ